MSEIEQSIAALARQDGRYHVDAYLFVFDALAYARDSMQLMEGAEIEEPASSDEPPVGDAPSEPSDSEESAAEAEELEEIPGERHLTGQQLCEAIRCLSLEQFGYMAKLVFNQWGVTKTGDFGHIVFNLIEIGQMRKTESDRREDFDDVFDFDRDLVAQYKIMAPE